MATYEELIAKSKELAAAGRMDDAKRVAEIALKTRNATPAAPKGNWFQRNILPDDDDTSLNAGETVAAMLNKAGEGMTLGLIGDEADARVKSWLPGGGTYDEELAKNRAQEQALWDKSPALSMGAELGGAVLPAMLSGGTSLTASGAGLGRKVATSAALGAGAGATYGFMEGEGGLDNRLKDAKTGALVAGGLGLAAPFAGAAVQKVADSRKQSKFLNALRKTAPTADDLKGQGRALYQQVDDAGVSFSPDYIKRNADEIKRYLRQEGIDFQGARKLLPTADVADRNVTQLAKKAAAKAAKPDQPPVQFQEVDTLRRLLQGAKKGASPQDATLTGNVVGQIDDMILKAGPGDLDGGDIKALQDALPKAREIWHRFRKTELLEDAMDDAGNYQSNKSSGLKNKFRTLLNNKSTRDLWTPAEKAAMRKVLDGPAWQTMIEYMGSGLGSMGQMAGATSAGAMMGGAGGAIAGNILGAIPAMATRRMAEKLTGNRAEIARALIASGKSANLPVASPKVRSIVESLMRRTGAATGQGL